MTTQALTIFSERWLDEVVLSATFQNVDGDISDFVTLPTGLGDVAIMEASIHVSSIATLSLNPELLGVRWHILNAATVVDIVGVTRWTKTAIAGQSTYVSPDPLVLWRQDERLNLLYQEVDTNAVPTADVSVTIKVVRVRPEFIEPGPIRLVRTEPRARNFDIS